MSQRIITVFGILIAGILAVIGLSEYYTVALKKNIENYPFGGEGPVPYYYKTAELYSCVNLSWGLVFLIVSGVGIWNWKAKKIDEIIIIGLIYGLILLQIFHNMFEYLI